MNALRLVLLLLAAATVVSCDGAIDDGVSVGPAVYGVAYDAATSQPLPDVRITIGERTHTTNVDGRYTIDVASGTYTLTATRAGYATVTMEVNVNEWLVEKTLYLGRQ